jgi:hypothetical protein
MDIKKPPHGMTGGGLAWMGRYKSSGVSPSLEMSRHTHKGGMYLKKSRILLFLLASKTRLRNFFNVQFRCMHFFKRVSPLSGGWSGDPID